MKINKMTFNSIFNLLLLLITINLYGKTEENIPEIKIAIVSQAPPGDVLADSVMAELSEQGIICLERTKIKKVLAEQKLSSDGFVSQHSIINCSRLLKVDLFTIIICSPKNKNPIGLVVFDTKSGIRLVDICLPEDFNEKISLSKNAVIKAISKNKKMKESTLKFLSFMPLNQIALQGDEAASVNLAELILMRIAGQYDDILVLERSQLDFLLQEQNLNLGHNNQLMTGTIFVQLEGEISGNKAKSLTLKLFIKNISGETNFSARESYAIGTEVETAQKLWQQMIDQLDLTLFPKNFDAKAEADKYFEECKLAQTHGMYDRASRMARNAYVLNPEYRNKLIEVEARISLSYLSHPGSSPLAEDVEKALNHAEFIFEVNDNSNETEKWIMRVMTDFAKFNSYHFNKKLPEQTRDRISRLRQQTAAILLNSFKQKYRHIYKVESANDMEEIAKRIAAINKITQISWDNSINNEYGLPLKEMYVANIDKFYNQNINPGYNGFSLFEPGRKPYPESQLTKLYRTMQKTSVPYFKIIATLHLHTINYPKSFQDPSYVDFLVDVINNYDIPDTDWNVFQNFLNRSGDNFIRMTLAKYSIKLNQAIYQKKGFNKQLLFKISCNKSDVPTMYSFMKRIQADTYANQSISSAAQKEIIDGTENIIKNLKTHFPECNIDVAAAPLNEKNKAIRHYYHILSTDSTLSQPKYNGEKIYTVSIDHGERFLYEISPGNKFMVRTGRKISTHAKSIENLCWEKYLACFSEQHYIMATAAGLFIFPLDMTSPQYFPLKEFSGFTCYSVTYMDNNVYIAYNKSVNSKKTPLFLVKYNLHDNSYSVVYASHQDDNNNFKEKNLDYFRRIYPDKIHNRLIIPAWTGSVSAELWALYPNSNIWKRLTDLPYYPQGDYPDYGSFVVKKNDTLLSILGVNVAYEFNTLSNQAKVIFFSNSNFNRYFQSANSAEMKTYGKWEPARPQWRRSEIGLVYIDGNKLWSTYHSILLKEKKAMSLVDATSGEFSYIYFTLDSGRFVIGSNHNCAPNNSLMVIELENDDKLPDQTYYSIAP